MGCCMITVNVGSFDESQMGETILELWLDDGSSQEGIHPGKNHARKKNRTRNQQRWVSAECTQA